MNAARAKRRPIHIRPRTPPGAAPGTIVVDPAAAHPKISIMAFGRDELEEVEVAEPDQAAGFLDKYPVTWIHVDGLGNADIIGRFGETFGLHPLALEDVIDINQRTKVEQYDSHLYIVIRMPILNEDFTTQQLNVFLSKNFIITFQ
jgi:magnesium transporter